MHVLGDISGEYGVGEKGHLRRAAAWFLVKIMCL